MKATFDNSVKVLLKAYLNDTLEHSNCHACAVGNLIAEANDFSYKEFKQGEITKCWTDNKMSFWDDVFMTKETGQIMDTFNYNGLAKMQIDSTGYPLEDLAKIEYAFEMAPKGKSKDDHMFNGLMSVIDVLAEIHNIELVTVKETKELFV